MALWVVKSYFLETVFASLMNNGVTDYRILKRVIFPSLEDNFFEVLRRYFFMLSAFFCS